jgi:large subunit ribosomal protein L13
LLRGKHKPQYARHVDTGDFVVIINAAKVAISGSKRDEFRYRHSGYPGGLSKRTVGELLESRPERVVELAVKGMLPKTTLGRAQLKKLKVYGGPEHPHAAQKPQPFEIKQVAQ